MRENRKFIAKLLTFWIPKSSLRKKSRNFIMNYSNKEMFKKTYMGIKIFVYKNYFSQKKLLNYPIILSPTVFNGNGEIIFDQGAQIGVENSRHFYSGYTYIEARSKNSKIHVGKNTIINNNSVIAADNANITIGTDCLIGNDFSCTNSDFHGLNTNDRNNPDKIISKDVIIGNNVFIGSNVSILKGVVIEDGCVIGHGSVVTKSFPKNSVIAGNPAKFIKTIQWSIRIAY